MQGDNKNKICAYLGSKFVAIESGQPPYWQSEMSPTIVAWIGGGGAAAVAVDPISSREKAGADALALYVDDDEEAPPARFIAAW